METVNKLLNIWLNQPTGKRNLASWYLACLLYEITTDENEKNELNEIIKEIETAMPNENLIQFKNMTANYLLQKIRNQANQIWDEREYNIERFNELIENS